MDLPIPIPIVLPKVELASESEDYDSDSEPTSDPLAISTSEYKQEVEEFQPNEIPEEEHHSQQEVVGQIVPNQENMDEKRRRVRYAKMAPQERRAHMSEVRRQRNIRRRNTRAMLTPEQIAKRRLENRQRQQRRRQQCRRTETSEQRAKRHQHKRAEETPEERQKRLQKGSERHQRQRAEETPEERQKRLQKGSERHQRQRAEESPEERKKRLIKQRERYKRRMAREIPDIGKQQLNRQDETRNQEYRDMMAIEIQSRRQEEEERLKVERDVRLLRIKYETEEQRRERRRKAVQVRRHFTKRRTGMEKDIEWIGYTDPGPEYEQREKERPKPRLECPVCSVLVKEDGMEDHLKTHPDATTVSFKCSVCPCTYPTVSELKLHRGRHFDISPLEDHDFYCEICSTIFYTRGRYTVHLNHHIKKNGLTLAKNEPVYLFICDFDDCQLCFRDKPRFIAHMETHSSGRVTFDCSVCEKKFSKESNCKTHMELAHTEDSANIMDCPYCHLVILNKEEDWEYHLWTHQIRIDEELQGNHLCENCGRKFRTVSGLKLHVKIHQNSSKLDRTPKGSNLEPKKPYHRVPCTVCNKILCGRISLNNHMLRNHTYEHGLSCYICNKSYKYLYILNAHIRNHNNEPGITKRAKCQFCARDFTGYIQKDEHHFYEHREEYLKTRPYCCTVCYRNFGTLELMKSHVLVHSKWMCHVCGKVLISQYQYDMHLRSHHIGPYAGTHKKKFTSLKTYKRNNSEYYAARKQEREREGLDEGLGRYIFQNGVGYVKITDIQDISNLLQNEHVPAVSEKAIDKPEKLIPAQVHQLHEHVNDSATNSPPNPVTEQKKYKCDRCPLQFMFINPLLTHISWHIAEEKMTVEPLNSVVSTVLPNGQSNAELEKYRNPDYVEVEVEESSVTNPLICPECAETFKFPRILSKHRLVKHGIYSTPEPKTLQCKFCPKNFAKEHWRQWHVQHAHQEDERLLFREDPATSSKSNTFQKGHKPKTSHETAASKPKIPKQAARKRQRIESAQTDKMSVRNPYQRTELTRVDVTPSSTVQVTRGNRFKCDECRYTTTRESALQRHKQSGHEVPAEAHEDEDEDPEFTLPDIKVEPTTDDAGSDMEWELDPIDFADTFDDFTETEPVFSVEGYFQNEHEVKCEEQELPLLPSISELMIRVADSHLNLSPNLQALAESLPLAFIPLSKVEVTIQDVQSEVKTTNEKAKKRKAAALKRKRNRSRNTQSRKKIKTKKTRVSTSTKPRPPRESTNKIIGRRKRVKCEVCGLKITALNMNDHMKTHSDDMSFKCNQSGCSQAFCNNKQLKGHIRRSHRQDWIKTKLMESGSGSEPVAVVKVKETEYYCDVCHKTVKAKSRFDRHLRTHIHSDPDLNTVIYTYHCDACRQAFRIKEMFLHHLETHGANGPNLAAICSVCSKTFAKLETLEGHMKKVHETEEKVYDCKYCHHAFTIEPALSKHEKSHQIDLSAPREGTHMCSHCGMRFRSLAGLNGHILRVHNGEGMDPRAKPGRILRKNQGGKVYNNVYTQCQVCGQTVGNRYLKNHMLKEHTYPHGLFCFVCDQRFTWIELLNHHIGKYHREEMSALASNPSEFIIPQKKRSVYPCPWCSVKKTYRNNDSLRKHQFQNHRELYLEENPYYCKKCFMNFATEDEHRGHSHQCAFQVARKGKKHECAQCGELFAKNAYLKVHMLKHGGERSHQCSMCDKKFTTIFNLRDHERRHTKNYTCYCPYCPENTVGFYKNVYLNQHVKKAHASGTEKMSQQVQSDDDSSSTNDSTAKADVVASQDVQSAIPLRHDDQARQVPEPSFPCLSLVPPSGSLAQPQQYVMEGISVPQDEQQLNFSLDPFGNYYY